MRPWKFNSKTIHWEDYDLEFDQDDRFVQIKRAVGTIHDKELEYAGLVEEIADKIARWFMGSPKTPWWDVMMYCIYVHIVLTMLVCFVKTDFINITLILFLLKAWYFSDEIKRIDLWLIVASIVISWVFDLFWMFFHLGSWFSTHNPEHSDVEVGVWWFCAVVTFISFIFWFVLCVVVWKISVEFDRLFKPNALMDEKLQRFASPPANWRVHLND